MSVHSDPKRKEVTLSEKDDPAAKELAQGMLRVNHLYSSALKVAKTQLEILDEEFASLYDHFDTTANSHMSYEIFRDNRGYYTKYPLLVKVILRFSAVIFY